MNAEASARSTSQKAKVMRPPALGEEVCHEVTGEVNVVVSDGVMWVVASRMLPTILDGALAIVRLSNFV